MCPTFPSLKTHWLGEELASMPSWEQRSCRRGCARNLGLNTRTMTLPTDSSLVDVRALRWPPDPAGLERFSALEGWNSARTFDPGEIVKYRGSPEAGRLIDTDMMSATSQAPIAPRRDGTLSRWKRLGVDRPPGRDISRARESADILQDDVRIHERDAIAAVYGFSIESEQIEQAKATDNLDEVHVFLETESF